MTDIVPGLAVPGAGKSSILFMINCDVGNWDAFENFGCRCLRQNVIYVKRKKLMAGINLPRSN